MEKIYIYDKQKKLALLYPTKSKPRLSIGKKQKNFVQIQNDAFLQFKEIKVYLIENPTKFEILEHDLSNNGGSLQVKTIHEHEFVLDVTLADYYRILAEKNKK